MRKQQSNHRGTKGNSKDGGSQQTDKVSTSTHTYTHTAIYADIWHTMNRSRTSHRAPKGNHHALGRGRGTGSLVRGARKKISPSHHHSQQAGVGEQALLTPLVPSPPQVEFSSPEDLQGSQCALMGCARETSESPRHSATTTV